MEELFERFPAETRTILERLFDKGCITVENGKISLSEENAKLLLILDRAGVFDKRIT